MSHKNYHDTLYAPFGGFVYQDEPFSNVILKKNNISLVYCPPFDSPEPGAMYPRAIVLNHSKTCNEKILATFECYTNKIPVFPIYSSTDYGKSWEKISEIEDKESGFGCRYQPHLFEVPYTTKYLNEGTILCAGNIIPNDNSSTSLRLYKSLDEGNCWEYVSEIISGGKAEVDPSNSDDRPVWEPFLIMDEMGTLYCFYSDEQALNGQNYNQALFHKTSIDGGKTWSAPVTDVAFADGKLRPGMPIITRISNGKYIMVYEIVNMDRVPVFFRISDSLDDWGDTDFIGNPIVGVDGRYISGTPYVAWIPYGGKNGTIITSGRGFSQIMANSNNGEGFWEPQEKLLDIDNHYWFTGYSQCLVPINNGRQLLNLSPINISDKRAMIMSAVADVYEKI